MVYSKEYGERTTLIVFCQYTCESLGDANNNTVHSIKSVNIDTIEFNDKN